MCFLEKKTIPSNQVRMQSNDPAFYDAEMAWNFMSSGNPTAVVNYYNPTIMLSFFGRLNYDYKSRYSLGATRADSSSKFAGQRWVSSLRSRILDHLQWAFMSSSPGSSSSNSATVSVRQATIISHRTDSENLFPACGFEVQHHKQWRHLHDCRLGDE